MGPISERSIEGKTVGAKHSRMAIKCKDLDESLVKENITQGDVHLDPTLVVTATLKHSVTLG